MSRFLGDSYMNGRKKLSACTFLILSGVSLTYPFADAKAQGANVVETTVDAVVVTAQKRAQAAQDVPVAISVVDQAAIISSGATSLTDVQNLVAGVQLINTNGVGTTQAVARGVTTISSGFEATSAVGLYVDETPVSAFTSRFPETVLDDVARIEFLRGPQGTLFGEGSMAGTVRVITNKPDSGAFSGSVAARLYSVESGDVGHGVSGILNVPLVTDELAVRISAQQRRDSGWIDVPALNASDVNRNKQVDLRVASRWVPNDRLTVDLSHTYQDVDQISSHQTRPGVFDPASATPGAGSPRRLDADALTSHLTDLTASYDFGGATLVSASALYEQELSNPRDFAIVVPLFFGRGTTGSALQENVRKARFFTQEVRLVSNGDNVLDWTIGGFYRQLDRREFTSLDFRLTRNGGPFNDLSQATETAESKSYAVFGQVDYDLTRQLSTTVGARYYSDRRDVVFRQLTSSAVFGTRAGTLLIVDAKDNAFSPNVQLNYKADKDTLLFARVAKGFRSGGTNENAPSAASIPPGYGPESIWAYEVGAKTRPMAWLTANAYAFYNDWTDIQLAFTTPDRAFGFNTNAGGARSYGAELELDMRPLRDLSIRANASHTNAKLTDDVVDPANSVVVSKGDRIPYVPTWSVGVSADYSMPVLGVDLLLHGDYRYRSETFSDVRNAPNLANRELHLVNLRVGIGDERWRVSVFAENVLDRQDTNSAEILVALPVRQFVRPRSFGVELRGSF